MHYTAQRYGNEFFKTYVDSKKNQTIVDIGSLDVNGSLRDYAPANSTYIGLDFAAGKSVDIILEDAYSFPLPDNYADVIVTSSCFEHSQFFWKTFMEGLRILKPTGIMYVSAPSNGVYHRYPTDNWRFYPDSSKALSEFAKTEGINAEVVESFIGKEGPAAFRDFVAVFVKDAQFIDNYPNRIYNSISKNLEPNNIWSYGSAEIINYQDWMAREDPFSTVNKQLVMAAEVGDSLTIENTWMKTVNTLATSSLYMASQNGHEEVVSFFLGNKVNAEAKASNGLAPLYAAIQNKHYKIAKMLLDYGVDPDTSLPSGATPLLLASTTGDSYSVALLLKFGARIDVSADGKNAVERAVQGEHQDVEMLLLNGLGMFCAQTENIQFAEICGKNNILEIPIEG